PVRYGLAIALAFLVINGVESGRERREILAQTRTYFGILKVQASEDAPVQPLEAQVLGLKDYNPENPPSTPYTFLMHGTTHHGLNFQSPRGLRRLATTYYHRKGPVGVIFERFNWFPGEQNTYFADLRMPASLIGFGATPMSFGGINDNLLVDLW